MLPEWRVALMPNPSPGMEAEDDDVAHVESDQRILEVRVHFRPSARHLTIDDLDRIIVHELLHPLLDKVLDFEDALKQCISPAQWDAHLEYRGPHMEEFIDRVARLIVDPSYDKRTYYTRWSKES